MKQKTHYTRRHDLIDQADALYALADRCRKEAPKAARQAMQEADKRARDAERLFR